MQVIGQSQIKNVRSLTLFKDDAIGLAKSFNDEFGGFTLEINDRQTSDINILDIELPRILKPKRLSIRSKLNSHYNSIHFTITWASTYVYISDNSDTQIIGFREKIVYFSKHRENIRWLISNWIFYLVL